MSLVAEHLEQRGVRFEVLPHPRADTALGEARVLEVPAGEVVKAVVLDIDSGHALALLPADLRLDLRKVEAALDVEEVHFASEDEIATDFPEFELGALPALPSLLHVPVVIDPKVLEHASITFAAGRQRESVRVAPSALLTGATVSITPITRPPE